MSNGQAPVWVSLLAGVVGSLLTLSFTGLAYWIRRPRLTLLSTENGCEIETPLLLSTMNGGDRTLSRGGLQKVLRLFVKNTGRTSAHDVSVSIIELSHYSAAADGGTAIMADEVLDLHLAFSSKVTFDLAPGAHRWIDLVYCDEFVGEAASMRSGFVDTPLRLIAQGFGTRGHYSAVAIATANNASAKRLRINFEWDGTLEGLKFRR